jgi:NADH-quinone oxidoreductase subunit F
MNIEQIRAMAEGESSYLCDMSSTKIYVGSTGDDAGVMALADRIRAAVDGNGLRAKVIRTGSFGCYDLEPIVRIEKPDLPVFLYKKLTPDSTSELIQESLLNKAIPRTGAFCVIGSEKANDIPRISDLPLFSLQRRIALRNCGWIEPENIHHYILRGQGYTGLSQALQMEPQELLEFRIVSALRNRCFAGDSTTDEWRLVQNSDAVGKCMICRAIDMDPSARTAQLLLESDPHSVLEGMLIGAYAVRASRCLVFVKEDTASARILRKALEQMAACNLLGGNILDSRFSTEIKIKEVSAKCVLGYETELFRCVVEGQPLPHVYPGYPVVSQPVGAPVVITNPEAMAYLSAFIPGDADDSGESKIVTLSGNVANKCTVEVNTGMLVRDIVDRLGEGTFSGKDIKTVRIGGSGGRFIIPDTDDFGVSGEAIEVFDIDSCIVEAVRDTVSFIQAQSCGRCVFCREGSLQMLTILEDLCESKGEPRDLDLLVELSRSMKDACLCTFGRAAPDVVLSSIELFRAEYEERIQRSPFPAQSPQLKASTENSES